MLYEVSKDFFFFNVVNQTLFPSFDMPAGYQQPKKSARLKNYAKPNICLEMLFQLVLTSAPSFLCKTTCWSLEAAEKISFLHL